MLNTHHVQIHIDAHTYARAHLQVARWPANREYAAPYSHIHTYIRTHTTDPEVAWLPGGDAVVNLSEAGPQDRRRLGLRELVRGTLLGRATG